MANFVFWNDLHTEFRYFELPALSDFPAPPDAVLLAGDSAGHPHHLDFAQRVHDAYGCPVVLVDGNHEFYGHNIDDVRLREDEILADLHAQGYAIHLLRGDAVEIAGVRIIGATLWTDSKLYAPVDTLSMPIARRWMADYRKIKIGPVDRYLEPEDTVAMHEVDRAAIMKLLAEPFDGPTVVMTHHMPAGELTADQYRDNPVNPAFASDMLGAVSRHDFDAWIFGHTHDSKEMALSEDAPRQQFLSNPRGYPTEATRFDPLRMLKL